MKRKYWVLLITCLLVLGSDQYTKYLVKTTLPLYRSVEVIPGFFNLTHVRNPGGAFGIFWGKRGGWGSFFFVGISVLAIGAIVAFFRKIKDEDMILALSFSLILAGALGNLIDRFRYGEVIDFLELYYRSFHWPAFNIADTAICVGIGLMALQLLIHDQKKAPRSKSQVPDKFQ